MEDLHVDLPGDARVDGHLRLAHLHDRGHRLLHEAQDRIGNDAQAAELLKPAAVVRIDAQHPALLPRPELTKGPGLVRLLRHDGCLSPREPFFAMSPTFRARRTSVLRDSSVVW